MRSYVDIEGSGQNVTIIAKRSAPAASDTVIATTAVHNSEIRSVTVERIPQTGNSLVTAISGTGNTISIRDASIIVNNGGNAAEAVVNKYGNISLQDVDIDSSHVSIRLEDNDLVQISDSNLASNASNAGSPEA